MKTAAIRILQVSIHAPAWGATAKHALALALDKFQSTPPHGGRRPLYHIILIAHYVSIHAPAWGATVKSRSTVKYDEFQSTPPHGGRHFRFWNDIAGNMFQSTPPHGGRRRSGLPYRYRHAVSIHAPAWGATEIRENPRPIQLVSIHAPAWGATIKSGIYDPGCFCFNPRPRMGGDTLTSLARRSFAFQSTPPHGGRPCGISQWRAVGGFNPRPRMGGDKNRKENHLIY